MWRVVLALSAACGTPRDAPPPAPAGSAASVVLSPAGSAEPVAPLEPAIGTPSCPVTTEFVRFENRDGPFRIEHETRPVGTPSKRQGFVIRFNNAGSRPTGAIQWDAIFVDAAGSPLSIETNHGPISTDSSAWLGHDAIVAPGETKDLIMHPNYGPIPAGAAGVIVELTEICELHEMQAGPEKGGCWWRRGPRRHMP